MLDEYDISANKIKSYLEENNLGNFENKEYEEAYIKFKQYFSPDILENLSGKEILNVIFFHDGDKSNLCYNLEFSNDYDFAGGIGGGSSYKYSLFKSNKTNQWTTGSSRKSRIISEDEAIEIGGNIRDALVNGAHLIESSDLSQISDYIQLENELGDIFSHCSASHLNQWVHKYYTLIFPDKFPVVHWDSMKKEFLQKFNIIPEEWYYALDGQLQLLTKKSGIKGYSLFKEDILELFENKSVDSFISDEWKNEERNLIYFGAPGTGKSYCLNKKKDNLLKNYEDNYERVTFHPDYTYANFVGTYKPAPKKDDAGNKLDEITYKYVPGPFMRCLIKSYKNPNQPVLLIIEEINRANVAAVFGDVFQLLDRDEIHKKSEYPISASDDIKDYLKDKLKREFDEISIPGNMFIWATMNSADQGVFPMDTAFKRRWDFKYLGIDDGVDKIKNIVIDVPESWNIKNNKLSWNDLRVEINNELLRNNINEDKLIGPFFAFHEYRNKELSFDKFTKIFENKILMYLFEDAARPFRKKFFAKDNKETYLTYSKLCVKFREEGVAIFNERIQDKFIKNNGE